jgi:hypothetical protein
MKLTALFAALVAGSLVLSGCNRGPDQPKNTGASSGGTQSSQSSSAGSTSGSQSKPADAPKRSQGKP